MLEVNLRKTLNGRIRFLGETTVNYDVFEQWKAQRILSGILGCLCWGEGLYIGDCCSKLEMKLDHRLRPWLWRKRVIIILLINLFSFSIAEFRSLICMSNGSWGDCMDMWEGWRLQQGPVLPLSAGLLASLSLFEDAEVSLACSLLDSIYVACSTVASLHGCSILVTRPQLECHFPKKIQPPNPKKHEFPSPSIHIPLVFI